MKIVIPNYRTPFSKRKVGLRLSQHQLHQGQDPLAPFKGNPNPDPLGPNYLPAHIGLKNMEASSASITVTLEPVVAAVVAYFWWGETFSVFGYVGCFLILFAVILMVLDGLKQ